MPVFDYVILNPGAELSGTPAPNWTPLVGSVVRASASQGPVHSGGYSFWAGFTSGGSAYQDLDAEFWLVTAAEIDAGDVQLSLKWWQANGLDDVDDTGTMGIEFYDGSMIKISEQYLPHVAYDPDDVYHQREIALQMPVGTRTIRLVQEFIAVPGTETRSDSHIDDITLTATLPDEVCEDETGGGGEGRLCRAVGDWDTVSACGTAAAGSWGDITSTCTGD